LPICSKRRLDAIAKIVNQIAKTQKLPAKHINQGFFDPSTSSGLVPQPRSMMPLWSASSSPPICKPCLTVKNTGHMKRY
ncbi:hypothetical protein, partial [Komagataeibacter xylinus]|uniref:hypothetical protein n=1 Tax=Komagataeibacter xylinus TaxID=28448 RepID=UPI0039EC39ED